MDLGLARGARRPKVAGSSKISRATNSAVLTEKLADLYDVQGKPSSAIDDLAERALKLNPSPEQRIRLRLTLGDKLLARTATPRRVENYRQLLAEAPDYPGRAAIDEQVWPRSN